MNLNLISKLKKELHNELKDKEILDIILFGSAIKGKSQPNDFDIALITSKEKEITKENMHISRISPEEFFINPKSLITTLFKEGYSLKNNKFFSENYAFSNRVLFKYDLTNQNTSNKVKIVSILRGKNKQKGMVEENEGQWLANQIFTIPPEKQYLFEQFFQNFNIIYKKNNILMH